MSAVSVVHLVRSRKFLAALTALAAVAAMLMGARIASADEVWFQSYQRASASEACVAQPGETPWQDSWGPNPGWSPSWELWANAGKGGWTCGRSITWAKDSSSSCATGGPCVPGDIGPGGGLVFLISGGLRYEMAPNTWGAAETGIQWCSDQTHSVATGTAVGTGGANTTSMLTSAPATSFVACTSSAPNAVRAYAGGGLTDWFLPSKDELNAMWLYSQVTGFPTATYGFASGDYWSSSQSSSINAWPQNLDDGDQDIDDKFLTFRVRPVRAF